MASETKLEAAEPAQGAARPPSARATESGARGDDDAPSLEVAVDTDDEAVESVKAEDEDVSVDELLISDESDDDEEDEATDIHPPLTPELPEVPAAAASGRSADGTAGASLDDAADGEPTEMGDVPDEVLAARQASAPIEEEIEEQEALDAETEAAPSEPLAAAAPGSEIRVARGGLEAEGSDADEQAQTSPEAAPAPLAPKRESSAASLESTAPERETQPDARRAQRGDAPLPSFDIPDLDVSARPVPRIPTPIPPPRPSAPPPAALPPLSELGEDDDDAVTHMGLPVPDSAYPPVESTGFEPAVPAVAALAGADGSGDLLDARRAATRVIPRIDPALIAARTAQGEQAAQPRLGAWIQSVDWRGKLSWALDNVLPPLSLVLFGSGIGAGIMLLQPEPAPVVAAAPAVQTTQSIQALEQAPALKRSGSLINSAQAGDAAALAQLDGVPARERSSAMTLALEAGYRSQRMNELQALLGTLDAQGTSVPPEVTAKLIDFATSSDTMLPALEALAALKGSAGPDLLYAVWEKAPGGSRAASVAQQLLQGADQRAKASPELLVALDLRSAQSCEDYAALLPAAKERGDERSSAALKALRHRDGCGADGRSDCYRCLRRNADLLRAISAVDKRPAPDL